MTFVVPAIAADLDVDYRLSSGEIETSMMMGRWSDPQDSSVCRRCT